MFPRGKWWPIFVPDFYGPRCSQHPLDPYSFTHILHGFICFGLWGYWPTQHLDAEQGRMWMFVWGAILCAFIEGAWEVIENSDFVLKKYRSSVGTSGDYKGDSYQNSIGDMISCIGGYYFCVLCVDLGVWHIPIVWAVVSELMLGFLIHDGLLLTIVQLTFQIEWLKRWQQSVIGKDKPEKSN